ncbi:MAG: hypothetical protein EPN85_01915 [Bacteroidetes bacterium]|nr:MAG: hypothetical protein EPN85_01915 [Bacteroidota bacterium]
MYNVETIKHLTKLIRGDDASRAWLQKNKFPELILLHYAIDGNDQALIELTRKKHVKLVAFVHAVLDDKRAFNWLAESKNFIWAATVRVTYKDSNAEAWLMRNNLSHYMELGRAIRKKEEDEAPDDVFGLMKKFINIFKSGPYPKG